MSWTPRSGLEKYAECCWLPRLIDKARYLQTHGVTGNELGNGYLYGDNDYIDGQLLRFLGITGDRLRAMVAANPSDDAVAAAVIAESGNTAAECRTFSHGLRASLDDFFVLEADEHRAGGPKASLARFIYNYILMPKFRRMFRKAEAKRAERAKFDRLLAAKTR
jgi:hypothetical protein